MLAKAGHSKQVFRIYFRRIGREYPKHIFNRFGHKQHGAAVILVGFCISLGEAGDVPQSAKMVVVAVKTIAIRQRG